MKEVSGKSIASGWINTPVDEAAATRTVESEDSSEISSGINQEPRKVNASFTQKDDNDSSRDTINFLEDMETNLNEPVKEPLTHKKTDKPTFVEDSGEPSINVVTQSKTVLDPENRSDTLQLLNNAGTNLKPIPGWVRCIANFVALIVECRMQTQTHYTLLRSRNLNEGKFRMEIMIKESIEEYRLKLYSCYLVTLLESMDITDTMIYQPSKCIKFVYDFMKGTVSWVQIYLYLANLMSRKSQFYEKHPGLGRLYHWVQINVEAIKMKSLELPKPGNFVFTSEQRNQLNEQVKFVNNLIMNESASPLNNNSQNTANISPLSQNSVRSPDCQTIGTNVPLQNYHVPTQMPTSQSCNVDVPRPMTLYSQNTIQTTVNHPAHHFNVETLTSSNNSTGNVEMSSTSLGFKPTLATEYPFDATFKLSTPCQSHVTFMLDEPFYHSQMSNMQTSSPSFNNLNKQIVASTIPSTNFNQFNVKTATSAILTLPPTSSSAEARFSTNDKAATDMGESNQFHTNIADLMWLDNYDSDELKRDVESFVTKACYPPLDSGIEGSPA